MNELLEVVSAVSRQPRNQLRPDLPLHAIGLNTSLAASILRSAIENRLQVRVPALDVATTIGEIHMMIGVQQDDTGAKIPDGSEQMPTRPEVAPPEDLLPETGLGIDIEHVDALPHAEDYSTHEFYVANFTPREVSQALLRPEVRQHLCGLFCAKEALKKSDDHLLDLRMSEIEVVHESSGRPMIRTAHPHLNDRYRFKVTISHTSQLATAVVLTTKVYGAIE